MRHTDFYKKYKELESLEREELKKAVLAHGGEFRFMTKDGEEIEGVQAPIVMAGDRHWDANCDCYITRVVVNNGFLEIYGYDKESGSDEILLDNVEFGHLNYIIDEIPETNEVHDVTTEVPTNDIPIVSLCRSDIYDAGYNGDVTYEELQQIASSIGKYLEWQEFWSQFLDNVREACECWKLAPLSEADSK